jgi:hypothetical protein
MRLDVPMIAGKCSDCQHMFAYRRWFYAAQQHASGRQGPGDARGTRSAVLTRIRRIMPGRFGGLSLFLSLLLPCDT